MTEGLTDPCLPLGLVCATRRTVDSRPSEGEKAMEIRGESAPHLPRRSEPVADPSGSPEP